MSSLSSRAQYREQALLRRLHKKAMADLPEARTTLQSVQATLEVGAKFLALIATLCVALSVLFDWGFLAALELSFSEVPTSLSDHARSAVLWLPLAAATIPLSVILSLFSIQGDAKDALEAKNRGVDISSHFQNEAKLASWVLAASMVMCFLLWLAFGYRARALLFMGAIAFWSLVVVRATHPDYLGVRLSMILRVGLMTLPVAAFGLYTGGYNAGRERIDPYQRVGTISVRSPENQAQLKANIVRMFEKSAIVIDEHHKILIIRPDDIVRVEKAEPVSINRGLLCDNWHIACPQTASQDKR